MKKQNSANENLIDTLKGIAIFTVILGHVIQKTNAPEIYESIWYNPIYLFIYTFHMPLFMLISGYLAFGSLQKRQPLAYLKSRTSSMLYNIVIWGTIHLVTRIITRKFEFSLLEIKNDYINSIWFLWAVLLLSIIIVIINGLMKKKPIFAIFLGFILSAISPIPGKTIFMYPFFIIGYLISANKEFVKKIYNKYNILPYKLIVYGFFLILYFVLLIMPGSKSFTLVITNVEIVLIDLLRYLVGAAGVFVVYDLAKNLCYKCKKMAGVFSALGRMSMQLYVFNIIFVEDIYGDCLMKYIHELLCWNIMENLVLFNIISLVVSIVFTLLLVLLIKLVQRTPILNKALFGGR